MVKTYNVKSIMNGEIINMEILGNVHPDIYIKFEEYMICISTYVNPRVTIYPGVSNKDNVVTISKPTTTKIKTSNYD